MRDHGARGQSLADRGSGRTRTHDTGTMPMLLLLPVLLLLSLTTPARGGICWSVRVRNSRCTDLFSQPMSKEECCARNGMALAWSADDLDSGTLFFWRVLGGGVPCVACKESCAGVQCGEGRRCVLKKGLPRCVCAPDCRSRSRVRGPVCGTDGRSYRTVCRLRKRACRKKASTLTVAYSGHCQTSCERIHCPSGRHCLLDQNLSPHCVKCAPRCRPSTTPSQVCGADGVTYQSACHLREAACNKGRAIPEAYKGRCKRSHWDSLSRPANRTQDRPETATCNSVRCRDRQSCLTEPSTGWPRCVTCSYRCPRPAKKVGKRGGAAGPTPHGPICGSNNITYESWCHMLKDACATGFVIETKFAGSCEASSGPAGNTVLDTGVAVNKYS